MSTFFRAPVASVGLALGTGTPKQDADLSAEQQQEQQHAAPGREASRISVVSESAGLLRSSSMDSIYMKISRRLTPLFICTIMLNQIDRNNLSYAALTLNRDLGFTARQYGLGSAVFFLSFFLFTVPSNLVMVRVGVRRWLAFLILGWGAVASSSALMHNAASFYVLRVMLGVFEAGATPAIWFHLTQFFPQERLTKPYMYLTMGLLLANVIGAPIAAGFLAMDGVGGLKGWQWLFMLEGLPSIAMAGAVFWLLPETPADAKFLSPSEQQAHADDMVESAKRSPPRALIPRNTLRLMYMVLSNPLLAYMSAIGFMLNLASYTYIFYLPLIINALLNGTALGNTAVAAKAGSMALKPVLLTSVPYAIAAVASWIVAHLCQRHRGLFVPVSALLLLGGVTISLFSVMAGASVPLGFVCLIIASSAVASSSGPCHVVAARICSGPSLVIGLPVYNSLGVLGGFAGPFLTGALLQKGTSGFTNIFIIVGCLVCVCSIMVAGLKVLLPMREKKLAAGGEQWAECTHKLPVTRKESGPDLSARGAPAAVQDSHIQMHHRPGH